MTLKLLSETRRACFQVCLSGALMILLLVFVQTISGKLEDATGFAWIWVIGTAILPLTTVWISVLLNRYPSKLFQPGTHWALVAGTAFYFLLALITLLAEPFATRGDLSTVQYLGQSIWWLLPIEALLLAGYYLAFWRKDSLFRPNAQLILDFAAQKASAWQQKGNTLRQQCFESIASNDMPGAFNLLKSQFSASSGDDLNAVVLLQNQYNELSRQRDFNLVEPGQAQISLNRITMGLINLVEKL
jgi:hypothetical protein